ncbi:hypothetical protein RHODO2019_10535 [Rhodococcus antarcticus]|uniref:Glycosyltransferase 2-like domain-containing protein n=1 Tax=Rhodococcus antarcticus TaxID=2987751 RepID=A0ABY6NW81_9NOCA|nr:glycosyltransferase family 2 protein [Rhodococcus antarcticus]UZJ23649.1 hypothetical protein RHODO2019_10535 [Rhodococcus antarcticus]
MTTELVHRLSRGEVWGSLTAAIFDMAVAVLIYGNVVYQLARWGNYRRIGRAQDPDPECLDALFAPGSDPGLLTVLIPSYREDVAVVRGTVLSAALQEYPDRRVVILVDDPPLPETPEQAAGLAAVRALPAQIHDLLAGPARELAAEASSFLARRGAHPHMSQEIGAAEAAHVADLYEGVARWLEAQAAREDDHDHTSRLLTALTFTARAAACRHRAQRTAARHRDDTLTSEHLHREYHRLATMFTVEVSTFERKQFVNLSHEPNKAMNLNAYIALLGRDWRTAHHPDGTHLQAVAGPTPQQEVPAGAVLCVPASPWLLTVDADSMLVHDYALRLVEQMTRPEHTRTAVMQTPYSAIPGAPAPLERTAGATTDIMHLVHQGSTHFRATYWVGANALLRTSALADIAAVIVERGHLVTRYIQDRTVIEDTESTVDLVDAGWGLHNYPARLAYSATPADYGSLLIQRRRWANGGLIILPKLLRSYLRTGLRGRLGEATMRVHYLVSIATVNIALLVLLMVPFTESVPGVLLVATSLPYFALYTRDLRLVGRRRRDLLEIYALNLLMLPVNLGGVVKSVHQAITGERIPFGRTPKVSDRTAAPALYVALTLLLITAWSAGAGIDATSGRLTHAVLGGLNAVILALAVTRYMGWRNAAADLTAPARNRLRTRPATANNAKVEATPGAHSPRTQLHPAPTAASTGYTPTTAARTHPTHTKHPLPRVVHARWDQHRTNTRPSSTAPTAGKHHLAHRDHQRLG